MLTEQSLKIPHDDEVEEDEEDDENVDGDEDDDEDEENEGDDENDDDEGYVRGVNEGNIGGKDLNELNAGGFDEDEEHEVGTNADDILDRRYLGEWFRQLSLDDVSYASKADRRNDNSLRPKPKSAIKYHLANRAENEAKRYTHINQNAQALQRIGSMLLI